MAKRWAWTIFAVTTFAYFVAVVQRSSLGVAAVEATERFDVAATALSMLAVAQIAVYAICQIPVGVLIDRIGPRAPLLAGAALMAAGQTIVGLSGDVGTAVLGRMLVGAGDATTFTSGIRLLAEWFEQRRTPFIVQIFAQLGQLGQLLSAFPFMVLLHVAGWLPAFLSVAALSVVAGAALLAATTAAGEPPAPVHPQRLSMRATWSHFAEAVRRPGTQLGFWAHFVPQASVNTFILMWGFPFLTVGLGYDPGQASALLTLVVVTGFVIGPILGLLSARFPLRRSSIILTIAGAIAAAWIAIALWPTPPPLWLVIVLIVVISVGGPGSLIGFDYARTFNPARQQGSANGLVNVGGFLATFVSIFLIGVVLDLLRGAAGVAGLYSLGSFRVAFLVQLPVMAVGVIMLLWNRRRVRRALRDEEGIVVAPLWVALSRRLRARRAASTGRDERAGVR